MVFAIFYQRVLIYTNYVPMGTMVNANYIMDALGKFLKIYKQKRPKVASLEQFFHWDNAPVHTAAVLKDWMAVKQFQVIEHPLYSPDLAPADFFLFPEIKKQLAGKSLTQQSFKKEWEGAARNLNAYDFSYAFRRWYEHWENCIRICGGYVEKR